MSRETRRIVLRWLLGSHPSINGEHALALLDTERWAGVRLSPCRHYSTLLTNGCLWHEQTLWLFYPVSSTTLFHAQ